MPSPTTLQPVDIDTQDTQTLAMNLDTAIQVGQRTIQMEVNAVSALKSRIDEKFVKACDIILRCTTIPQKGRAIVTGMGKSGHIGNKIAATLASTGTPAFFVHPAEASHGDLGMITRDDVVIAISYSGKAQELVGLLPFLKRMGTPLISLSGKSDSPLAMAADINLDISVEQEACPLNLAPTSSTTATLVMGDALAIALLEARGFSAEDFAFSHPGGALGRRLLLKVEDIMHGGIDMPRVSSSTALSQALVEMTEKGLGMTTVVDTNNALIGVFTDGDLRRHVDKGTDLSSATMEKVMSPNPKTVHQSMLAAEALGLMENLKITAVIVEDSQHQPVGVVHMHDILRAGVM